MTESAKRAFLNALVYMRRFDGQRPLVKKVCQSREWCTAYVDYLRKMADQKGNEEFVKYLRTRIPAEAIQAVGLEPDKLDAWIREHLEYLHATERGPIVLDRELQRLGVSNRTGAFLDALLARLEKDPRDSTGLELARRYLPPESTRTVAEIVAFLKQDRSRLFFSDVGGYRWFVDTNPK